MKTCRCIHIFLYRYNHKKLKIVNMSSNMSVIKCNLSCVICKPTINHFDALDCAADQSFISNVFDNRWSTLKSVLIQRCHRLRVFFFVTVVGIAFQKSSSRSQT